MASIDLNLEKKILTSLIETPEKFIQSLVKLSIEFREDDDTFKQFVLEFVSESRIDLLNYALKGVESGVDVYSVTYFLKNLINEIPNLKVQSLFDLLSIFADKMKNNMMSGMFFEPILKWAELNRVKAEALQELILEKKAHDIFGYITATIVGISGKDFELSFGKVLSLTKSNDEHEIATGLRSIGGFQNIPKKYDKEIQELLKKNNKSIVPTVASSSTYSIGRLVNRYPKLENEIVKSSTSQHIEVRFEVSRILRLNFDEAKEWSCTSFLNLSDIDTEFDGVVQAIDSILYKIIKGGESLNLVEEFFERWIASHEYVSDRRKIDETFNMAFTQLFKHRSFVERLITNWFNNDNVKFHIFARDIIDFMMLHKFSPPSFDQGLVSSFSEKDILYVVRKLIGHVFDFDMSSALLFSLLKHPSITTKTKSLIATVFVDYIGYNYAVRTIEFCEKKLDSKKLSGIEREVTKVIYKNVKLRFDAIKKLPRLDELRPKMDDVLKIEREKDRQMAKIMEQAQARSKTSLLGLVTKIGIKEGRGWFSFTHGQFTGTTKMKSLSESIEIPKGDVLDVVKASMDRQRFRLVKRSGK